MARRTTHMGDREKDTETGVEYCTHCGRRISGFTCSCESSKW